MENDKAKETVFFFKQFSVRNRFSAMKVGTDGVLLGSWALADTVFSPRTILDAGCGTGVIALMMAQRFPDAEICGLEIDQPSADEAADNFSSSSWADRLNCINGDFSNIRNFISSEKIDLLISNPPFFRTGPEAPGRSRSMARHEGALSPVSLVDVAKDILSPEGRLCFISTEESRGEVEFQAELGGLALERRTFVRTGEGKPPRRILWQFVRKGTAMPGPTDSVLTIRNRSGEPTEEYKNLVSPYYLYIK